MRTDPDGIPVVGAGSRAISFHLVIDLIRSRFVGIFTLTLGIFSCIFGLTIIFPANRNYNKKQQQIIDEPF